MSPQAWGTFRGSLVPRYWARTAHFNGPTNKLPYDTYV